MSTNILVSLASKVYTQRTALIESVILKLIPDGVDEWKFIKHNDIHFREYPLDEKSELWMNGAKLGEFRGSIEGEVGEGVFVKFEFVPEVGKDVSNTD